MNNTYLYWPNVPYAVGVILFGFAVVKLSIKGHVDHCKNNNLPLIGRLWRGRRKP